MGFGTVLKNILAEKQMSIKELSEITGIPLNTLYSITKRDTINVRQETIEKISDALDMSSDELIKRLQQDIYETQLQLESLQQRLHEAQQRRQIEQEYRSQLAHCLKKLTGYNFNDNEIGIIIATAALLKNSSDSE